MRLWPRKQVYLDDLPKTHDFRFAVFFVVLFAAVIGAVYAVGYFVAGDRLATGTTVAGVDVGGMNRDEARTTLQEELAPRMAAPITVTAGDEKFELDPQEAGLVLDIDASVDKGLGSSAWDPKHMLEVVTGGQSHEAVLERNDAEFQAAVDTMAKKVEREPVDASVRFAGGPRYEDGIDGVVIDRLAFANALRDAVFQGSKSVALPLDSVPPDVTTTEASDFVTDVAEPAVAAPVKVRVADSVLEVRPAVFAPALRAAAEGGELQFTADQDLLYARSRPLIRSLPHQPVNARFEFRAGRPVVVPSRSGATVAAPDWSEAVVVAAQRRGDQRRAAATVTESMPDLTTQQARQLGISTEVGSVEVRIPGSLDDAEVRTAVGKVDGSLVRPQRTLSLQARMSPVSSDEASVVATALFDAAFRAGLGTGERNAPAVHTVGEAGLDAVVGNGNDLAIVNNTPYGVLVRAAVIDGTGRSQAVRLELWGTDYWNVAVDPGQRYAFVRADVVRRSGARCQPDPGRSGFSIEVHRTVSAEDSGEATETVPSTYRAQNRVVCSRR